MKNIYSILSLLLGAMIALASCNSEEIPGALQPEEGDMPIEFSGINASVDTKTGADGVNGFRVWASRTNNNASVYNIFATDGTEVTKTTSGNSVSWAYSPIRYWQPGTYNFYATSPTAISTTTPITGELSSTGLAIHFGEEVEGTYTGWDLSAIQTDFMFAKTQDVTGRFNGTNTPVSLAFDHMLSKISFSAKNTDADDDVSIIVTGIKISGCHTKSLGASFGQSISYQFPDQASGHHSIAVNQSSLNKDGYQNLGSSVLVFPQTCTNLVIELTFIDVYSGITTTGNTTSASISIDWEPGKQYHYNINVSFEKISIGTITVKDWATGKQIGTTEDF